MSDNLFPESLPDDAPIDATEGAGTFAPTPGLQDGATGAGPGRPGDPDPAPEADKAPIFSTDPLG